MMDGDTLAEWSIGIIRQHAPHPSDGPYWLAYSGGKDSDVLLDLAKRSGVPFQAHYNFVPIDPPELRQHIREMMKDPANWLSMNMPVKSLRRAIIGTKAKPVMPLRNRRLCCEVLKERNAPNATMLVGVRWEESQRRSKRHTIETCRRAGGVFVHPIINWKTADIWRYIRERNLPYCRLYDEGWKRIGCVLCPMTRDIERQIARWPGIARVWRKLSDEVHKICGDFPSADAAWAWWLDRDAKWNPDESCPLFDGVLE